MAIKGEKLTAAQAIKKECWYCFGMARSFKCPTKICKLADKSVRSSVKRIKAHCITCVPEQSIYAVKKCRGEVLNPISHFCPLHPFRMGKNPNRVKTSSPHLKQFRFNKETRTEMPVSGPNLTRGGLVR